jgi:cytochrome c
MNRSHLVAWAIIILLSVSFYSCSDNQNSYSETSSTATDKSIRLLPGLDSLKNKDSLSVEKINREPETMSKNDAVTKEPVIKETKEPSKNEIEPEAKKVSLPEGFNPAEIEEGKLLISKSDCAACHKIQEKLVGPSYLDVADKYSVSLPAIIQSLTNKIINGGSGVWGQMPMSPHPSIAQGEAKKMVAYILSLKN